MENGKEKPSYVLKFNEKFIRPKNESVTKDIIVGSEMCIRDRYYKRDCCFGDSCIAGALDSAWKRI